jgi:hypothetical protein
MYREYTFLVTRDVTESAKVTIRANSIEEAQTIALSRDYEDKLDFQPDDGSGDDPYLADEHEWEWQAFDDEGNVLSRCSDCHALVVEIIGCPDGAEVCADCLPNH